MLLLVFILSQECIAIKHSLRIYGGIDAKSDEYPFVVRIDAHLFKIFTKYVIIAHKGSICTASALSPIWVMSAAHCLLYPKQTIIQKDPTYTIEKVVIRYAHAINSAGPKNSYSEVLYTVKHPLYIFESSFKDFDLLVRNDIGLLKSTTMNIGTFIKLSAVDYKTFYGHKVVITGLGISPKKDSVDKGDTYNPLLLEKPLQLFRVLVSKCAQGQILVPSLCLAPRCKDVALTCPGDSGGPIIHPSGLIGVVSLGTATGYCLSKFRKERGDVASNIVPVSPCIEWIYSYLSI